MKIDSTWYRNYREGNFYQVVKVAPYISSLEIHEGLYWSQKSEIVKVLNRKVKTTEIEFKMKPNYILKQL